MKKLISTLLLAGLIPACMFGAEIKSPNIAKSAQLEKISKVPSVISKKDLINPNFVNKTQKDDNILQAGTYTKLYNHWIGGYYSYNETDISPICYEPTSGNLMVVIPDWDGAQLAYSSLNMMYSTNNGTSWSTKELVNDSEHLKFFPSIAAINPTPSNTDINNLLITVSTGLNFVIPAGTNSLQTAITVVKNNTAKKGFSKCPSSYATGYVWNSYVPSAHRYNDDDMNLVFGASILSPLSATTNKTYGNYGNLAFDCSDATFVNVSSPSEWSVSPLGTFRPGEESSYYSDHVQTAIDENGVIYAAFQNYFNKVDADRRLLGVCKSTDMGLTWGDFNVLPRTVLDEYGKQSLGVADFGNYEARILYTDNSFVQFGNGNFSFVCKLMIREPDKAYKFEIVEISYIDGQWKIKPVEDITYTFTQNGTTYNTYLSPYSIGFRDDLFDNDSTLYPVYTENARAHELQVAVTKDNKYLVAKWINNQIVADTVVTYDTDTYYCYTYNSTSNVWEKDSVTSYNPTDIYLSYRELPNGDWSEPINVTRDKKYNHMTFMPSIIPDINHIPVTSCMVVDDYQRLYRRDSIRLLIPTDLREYLMDGQSDFVMSIFDVQASDVKETIQATEFSIYPNPVADNSYIKLNVADGKYVSIEVFNMLGEKVLNVFNGTANSSVIPFSTNELANGAYVCKVTNGSSVSSVVFTVSK